MFGSSTYSKSGRPCPRKFFGNDRGTDKVTVPDLMQKKSYDDFLQIGVSDSKKKNEGLEAILRSSFPISNHDNTATVDYTSYRIGDAKYDVWEALQRGVNYSAPLFIKLKIIVWDTIEQNLSNTSESDDHADLDVVDEDYKRPNSSRSGRNNAAIAVAQMPKEVKSIKEQEVYLGDIPIMTDSGSFVVNGAQRVIVSQMHRSPGVFYFKDDGKSNVAGKYIYSARVIPYKGLWLDIEFDSRDVLYFRIDKKRKILLTTLLFALGCDTEEILREFYDVVTCRVVDGHWVTEFNIAAFEGTIIDFDIINVKTKEKILSKGDKFTPYTKKKIEKNLAEAGIDHFDYIIPDEKIANSCSIENIYFNDGDKSIEIASGGVIDAESAEIFKANKRELKVVALTGEGNYIKDTLLLNKVRTKDEAVVEIYKMMKAGENVLEDVAENFFEAMFYGEGRYDLSAVGRMKINMKHGFDVPEDYKFLRKEDILAFIKHLIALKNGNGEVDDIDHLGNRRVRCVSELLENQFKIAMTRIEKSIFDKMNVADLDSMMLHDLINIKALSSSINEFFGTSQLSQFMDQINPLSEVTHKRRISALGPGGLTRERAGADVRDVHPTHYGRICPIETPEGQNIGLINSLASYATLNKYGFIETPYFKVENGKITDTVRNISAIEEWRYTIAQANEEVDAAGCFTSDMVNCRRGGEFILASPAEIDYIDVSPKQLLSVSSSLIPGLEHDDASRALMGANMQRQAVPLIRGEAPLVGTGMEGVIAKSSSAAVFAKRGGIVQRVDAKRIVIKVDESEYFDLDEDPPFIMNDASLLSDHVDVYDIMKYLRSNNNTTINQRVVVDVGDKVKKGQLLADSCSTEAGELALGKNVFVAFMPWNGYNFEDSILVSERIVKEDVFTSIQIQQYDVIARDTMLGPEEITRSIPGVSEAELSSLSESGIVNIGTTVKPNDILVGKVAPKSEVPLMPEEKLLRAIFGEKVADVKDASLRVPPGEGGTVIGSWIFTRRGVDKSERAIASEKVRIDEKIRNHSELLNTVKNSVYERLEAILVNSKVNGDMSVSDATESANAQHHYNEDDADIFGSDATQRSEVSAKLNRTDEGVVISRDYLHSIAKEKWWNLRLADEKLAQDIIKIRDRFEIVKQDMQKQLDRNIERIQSGDDLAQGALQVVKVLVATKMRLQPGDKMAGRHGNKGVISKIVPIEDMPYLEDGTPVDIVLNPIGVPSRMNVGQILETHLGWASAMLGKQIGDLADKYLESQNQDYINMMRDKIDAIYEDTGRWPSGSKFNLSKDASSVKKILDIANRMRSGIPFASPVFDGAKDKDINKMLREAGVKTSGQITLTDGRTGEVFDRDITVGYIYMMKLDHLVANKAHARSIGGYSLVTQQPLGGKSHFGGQRFGEMECWALQAYGAAYTLQEMLTVKSDDVTGRGKMYESIVKGDATFDSGIPESFNVMIKELRSLCINIGGVNTEEVDIVNGRAVMKKDSKSVDTRAVTYGSVTEEDLSNIFSIDADDMG